MRKGGSMDNRMIDRTCRWRHHYKYGFCIAILLAFYLFLSGCAGLTDLYFRRSVVPVEGDIRIAGLKEPVTVRRDAYGIPFIEAKSKEDLAWAIGYVNAADRFGQMTGIKLFSQGRLAEMAGPVVLDLDMYMRAMNLGLAVENLLTNTSPENLALLARYADGVNAYVAAHQDRLPPSLRLAGYKPEPWTPADSLSIFAFVNFALAFNLHEEIASLIVAQKIGAEKTAWVMPIYPDEPLPFAEAAKLEGLDLSGVSESLSGIAGLYPLLHAFGLSGQAASNNWAIGKDRTEGRASILANDQHLVLSMPAIYNLMHIRCPQFDAAGVNMVGLPAMVAGYNGHVAWGMTMVMADNQDIFLEQIKSIRDKPHYLYKGRWLPANERNEIFRVKGKEPVSLTIHETVHGPLLNDILGRKPVHVIQSKKLDLNYGIAISQANIASGDKSVDSFFALSMAKSVEEASTLIKQIRSIPLNMVFADRDNIAWQVTGNYPVRAAGRGMMPSPGWKGEYDWTGVLDESQLPFAVNPAAGFIGTANHRTIAKDDPRVLSSSWYWPERAERIEQMILASEKHTLQTSIQMQMDTQSLFVPKLKEIVLTEAVVREIAGWPDARQRQRAHTALALLKDFDGNMTVESPGAALVSAFLDQATRNIFLDELGPADANIWQAFLVLNNESYNATCDHLLMRGDESPFWDDIRTPLKETKVQLLARSLEDALAFLEKKLGSDARKWRWGALHTYHWETDTYALLPRMGRIERAALNVLRPYFNRGPYPAPGDHTTLNVSNYMIGKDFKTWIIPSVRLIVDFSRTELMIAVNSAGQSDHPSSPHYADGITLWREGGYIPFPLQEEGINARYNRILTLHPIEKGQ